MVTDTSMNMSWQDFVDFIQAQGFTILQQYRYKHNFLGSTTKPASLIAAHREKNYYFMDARMYQEKKNTLMTLMCMERYSLEEIVLN